jgi:uncharacterized protein (TIGR02453 family)
MNTAAKIFGSSPLLFVPLLFVDALGCWSHRTGMSERFTEESLKFLRGLKRNNDRDWFEARRGVFEGAVKAPMLGLVEEINAAMESFAPEHVRPANKIMMRIYRDIRFSKNKMPYKTHVSAWWARRGMEKTSGGGFYLQISPVEVMLAAGVYMPEREQLLALRRWMSEHHAEYRAVTKKLMKAKGMEFTGIEAQALTRMPKGFAADDPADELLRAKNWGVHAMLPAGSALEPEFGKEIVKRMRATAPLVEMLNGAILEATPKVERRPIF